MSSSSLIVNRLCWRVLPGLLLSLSLGSSLLQHAVAGQKVPNSEVKVIQKLIFERKMAEAAPRLDTAMANYPDSGRLAFLLGQLYYFSNLPNYPKAVAAYDKAELMLSEDPELYFFRAAAKAQVLSAYSQRQSPDYVGALADYRKAEALGSERDLRLDIARAIYETRNYSAALEQINRYLNNKPQLWADGQMLKGNILAQMGQHEAALKSYQRAARQYDYLDKLQFYQAVSLRALGQSDEALAQLDKGLKRQGRAYLQLVYLKAMLSYEQKQYQEAALLYQQLIERRRDWALPLLGYYNSLSQMGEAPISISHILDLALKLDPEVVVHFHQQDLLRL
ncbi:tetratricopeptide repeat protein [Shewanella chilikensis]|uniref:tetratricopeptide repeat protein n=1 Tax=Shewanella chilikensis TaxID=558541 RepID=UPI00399ADA1B